MQVLDRCETLKAPGQCRGGSGARSGTQLALLILQLHVKTQISHRVKGVGGFAAFVAHDAAAQLAVEGPVEEAFAFGIVAF